MTDPEQLKAALKDHAVNVAARYKNDWTYLDAVNERKYPAAFGLRKPEEAKAKPCSSPQRGR